MGEAGTTGGDGDPMGPADGGAAAEEPVGQPARGLRRRTETKPDGRRLTRYTRDPGTDHPPAT